MQHKIAVIVAKSRNAAPEQEAMWEHILAELVGRPEIEVVVLPHLYDLAPDGPSVRYLQAIQGDMIVLASLYPRSAYWVLRANQIEGRLGRTSSLAEGEVDDAGPLPTGDESAEERTIWCFDLRTHHRPERYLREINRIVARVAGPLAGQIAAPAAEEAAPAANGHPVVVEETPRIRWYPVVDFSRCNQCQECLNFCLFGVFSVDEEQRMVIEQPDACRPGCPACARICPSGAIMFPQHKDPAIAGDPEASLEGLKLDLSQIFSGLTAADIAKAERRHALQERAAGASRGSKPKDGLDELVDKVDDMDL